LTVGGAALPHSPVVRGRETVTGLLMEGSMMVTEAAGLASSVGATTVRSSELTTMRRTTAVRDPVEDSQPPSNWGPWSGWKCVAPGTFRREQKCRSLECSLNNGRVGSVNTQERYSRTDCF